MKKKCILILTLLTLSYCAKLKNYNKDLSSEMNRIVVDTVMIVKSQAIDEYPLWSPDSDFVAANVMGEWYKFKLKNIELSEAEWHKQKIGILIDYDVYSPLTKNEQTNFRKVLNYGPRLVYTKNKDKIELHLDGFSTSLIMTKHSEKPKILWTTGLENCHSLSVSPDEKYVAYLCELNGLFVIRLK